MKRPLLRKKRYGKKNRGETFIYNMLVDSLRNAGNKRKSRSKEQAKAGKEALERQARISFAEELAAASDEKAVASVDPMLKAVRVSKGRWIAYWISIGLMFWGIHLMKESTSSWVWFVPMLLPFMGILQNESEKPLPLGFHSDPAKQPGFAARFFDIGSASIIAIFGVFLMTRSPENWYVFIPFLLLFLVLLPQKWKQWQKEIVEDEIQKKARKAQRKARRESSIVWKLFKILFWIGLLWIAWQVVTFLFFMFILG